MVDIGHESLVPFVLISSIKHSAFLCIMGKCGMGHHAAKWRCQLSRIRAFSCSDSISIRATLLQSGLKPKQAFLLISIISLIFPVQSSVDTPQNQHSSANSETISKHHNQFTDQWAVHIVGGVDRAHEIASKHGFVNIGQIFPDYYHFAHSDIAKRSVEPCRKYHHRLSAEPDVKWHAQQVVKRRTKRDYLEIAKPFTDNRAPKRARISRTSSSVSFTDPRWPAMWYLNRGPGLDMNVQQAWDDGITGKGVVVTILDDGLEKDHPDIVRNYDPMASFDVNSLDSDPMPTYDLTDSNRHGTRCAGEVAAEANNSICAVGIAFEAGVGGVRMLDGDVTDAVEARSLSHNPQHIDIYSASWGPDDDGKTVDGPGELATRAFQEGITKGRGGKGSIFVWASGNGGRDHDNCNCDGYTNSIWTLSISSATENGLVPWYSEACSSTLATTYSSGGTGEKQIVTIDLHHSCTSSHTGTSASAPLAAGICALALQANTNLTWRDMQHIVVRTARPPNLIASDWARNGVGRNVSHSFGYGLMDAGAMVKLAKTWRTVPDQKKCEVRAPYSDKNIPAKSKVILELKVTNCPGVRYLEHVQAKVTLTSGRRGDLQIYLVSPSGTRSVLLAHRRHDLNRSGFTDWPFMTVHCWDENPLGKWILEIHNEGRYVGKLKTWTLVAHGIPENPNDLSAIKDEMSYTPGNPMKPVLDINYPASLDSDGTENKIVLDSARAHSPDLSANAPEVVADMSSTLSTSGSCIRASISGKCLECADGLALFLGGCLKSCPDNYFMEKSIRGGLVDRTQHSAAFCSPCHYSCKACTGGNDFECLSCHDDSKLHSTTNTNYATESRCYSLQLLSSIESNQYWYKAVVVIVIVNAFLVIPLMLYICCRRHRVGIGDKTTWMERRTYSRVSSEEDNTIDTVDFRYSNPKTLSTSQSVPSSTVEMCDNGT